MNHKIVFLMFEYQQNIDMRRKNLFSVFNQQMSYTIDFYLKRIKYLELYTMKIKKYHQLVIKKLTKNIKTTLLVSNFIVMLIIAISTILQLLF